MSVLIVGLPLLAAIVCMLVRKKLWLSVTSVSSSLLLVLMVGSLLLNVDPAVSPAVYPMSGWGAPLGIELSVDGLSLIMLFVTSLVVLLLSVYSTYYFNVSEQHIRFWPLWWFLIAGLNVAFIARDAFNIYVALEMIGLAAVALVAVAKKRAALVAALRYAMVGLVGSLCYLLGIALLYRLYGTLDLSMLANLAEPSLSTSVALCLISLGLLLKTALFPFHFWLPPAHASAPAPVSAALSALVVKASFYLLLRFWLEVLAPSVSAGAANVVGVLGACAIIWGSLCAYRATRLKLVVAYSTVAQLGYLFLVFPIALAGDPELGFRSGAVAAVAYFVIAHALAKSAMFLAAGNILASTGNDDIRQFSGFASRQPIAVFTIAIAGISLIGLPPSGGFIAKWLLLTAAVESQQWWWLVVMLVGGLLTALYLFRILGIAFEQNQPLAKGSNFLVLPKPMVFCGLALALLAIAGGFNAEWVIQLIDQDMSSLHGMGVAS
ncbi:MAG: oxidoreductase [Kangiellaceae bacterium]|nr:oxidoreductase [Kangiellaceae bacterium]|tara:strand:+ start:8265 stop:9743 length:1479 start_codon:yes stop_codon:yes gene_type:complete